MSGMGPSARHHGLRRPDARPPVLPPLACSVCDSADSASSRGSAPRRLGTPGTVPLPVPPVALADTRCSAPATRSSAPPASDSAARRALPRSPQTPRLLVGAGGTACCRPRADSSAGCPSHDTLPTAGTLGTVTPGSGTSPIRPQMLIRPCTHPSVGTPADARCSVDLGSVKREIPRLRPR
jgi:hypothetical protein